jgi:hypothetical protein
MELRNDANASFLPADGVLQTLCLPTEDILAAHQIIKDMVKALQVADTHITATRLYSMSVDS